MEYVFEFMKANEELISLLSSLCLLIVTSIYAVITWWQANYTKKTLLASVKQYRDENQPYIVPAIESV